jgi:AraC-like DNA-binding protein
MVPTVMEGAHTHSDIEMNLLADRPIVYLHGGVRRTVSPGRLVVFWAGVPHQLLAPAGAAGGIWVHLPLTWLLQWRLPRNLAGRLLAGEFFEFKVDPAAFAQWPAEHSSLDPEIHRLLQLEIQFTLSRLAIGMRPSGSAKPDVENDEALGGHMHVSRVTSFLARHYAEALSLQQIASAAKLHPAYLMRLFKRLCHITVWEYLTRLRVSHAQRLLVTSQMRVLDVALESGFGSLAPFYHAFKRYTGTRPLAFRRTQRLATITE